MDEQRLKRELLRLAEPPPVSPLALDTVADKIAGKRRNRRLGAGVGVVALLVSLGVFASQLSGDSTTVHPAELTGEIKITTYAYSAGISMSITLRYPQDRVLSSPSVRVGKMMSSHGDLTLLDDVDHGKALYPLALAAGARAYFSVLTRPECREDPESPKIEYTIPTRFGEEDVVDRLVPSNPEQYRAAYRFYCDLGVTVQTASALGEREGHAAVDFLINNASKREIKFAMPALTVDDATWKALKATVPAGQRVTLRAVGSGASVCNQEVVPWAAGRILINGKPSKVPVVDAWSGAGGC